MDDRALMTLMDGQTRLKEEELRHFLCQFLSTEWQKRSDQRNEGCHFSFYVTTYFRIDFNNYYGCR